MTQKTPPFPTKASIGCATIDPSWNVSWLESEARFVIEWPIVNYITGQFIVSIDYRKVRYIKSRNTTQGTNGRTSPSVRFVPLPFSSIWCTKTWHLPIPHQSKHRMCNHPSFLQCRLVWNKAHFVSKWSRYKYIVGQPIMFDDERERDSPWL